MNLDRIIKSIIKRNVRYGIRSSHHYQNVKKKKVYRYLNEYDITDLYVGKILKIEHSLTTTQTGRGFMPKYNWIGKYIIKCKSLKKTKAHDVSVLWDSNYSILKGEKQINFEEGTSFLIDKIIYVHGKPYIYMHEI